MIDLTHAGESESENGITDQQVPATLIEGDETKPATSRPGIRDQGQTCQARLTRVSGWVKTYNWTSNSTKGDFLDYCHTLEQARVSLIK
jgi:hypothetical protein